jgi:hypothetical protein
MISIPVILIWTIFGGYGRGICSRWKEFQVDTNINTASVCHWGVFWELWRPWKDPEIMPLPLFRDGKVGSTVAKNW